MKEGFNPNKPLIVSSGSEDPKVTTYNRDNYFLCSEAEPVMVEALARQQVILVSNSLLLKFRGRLAALAIRDCGKLKKGYWYSPLGREDREWWRYVYAEGMLHMPSAPGEWLRIRRVRHIVPQSDFPLFTRRSLWKSVKKYIEGPLDGERLPEEESQKRSKITPRDDMKIDWI